MSYAPDDLKAIQAYCQRMTLQPWYALGIVGDATHNADGGYHVGRDVMLTLGTAPEQPGTDYSYAESDRDRRGLTDAASAFDLGGDFLRFREVTLSIVAACQRGDPRTRDVREVIYTRDGSTVQRWDRLGVRTSGDDSHLWHTHVSFFRDAEGRRADGDNFLGLLTEVFEGSDMLADEHAALMEMRDRLRWIDPRIEGMAGLMQPSSGPPKGTTLPLVDLLRKFEGRLDTLAVGGVDMDALAVKVADLLAQRLGNG